MVRRWPFDGNAPRLLHEEPDRGGTCQALALDAPGLRLACHLSAGPSTAPRLEIRDVSCGELLAACETASSSQASLAWSPDGALLARVEEDRVVVHDTATLEVRGQAELKDPCFVEFSPDGELLAVGAWSDGRVERLAALDVR